ncbi:MAG TPA: Ig-like domain-containing protein [Solirubrobacteraceae bacterium]|jgi:hypothetical protein|nr:Ig-like domain-containing protein [Solirubrobacteraceae bacterium]
MEGMKTAVGVIAAGLAALLGVGAMPASAAASTFSPAVATTGTVQFTSTAPTDAVVGGPTYTPTASTDSDQPVSFAVDALTTNNACTPASGSFSFAHAGTCVIDARVAADQNYGAAQAAPQTLTVSPASTSTSLVVGASALTANVTAATPGSGTPTGTVEFSVDGRVLGSSSLVNGVATLGYTVPPNVTETILASYQGVPDYTTSSATLTASGPNIEPTFVAKPTIAARLTSAAPKNRQGWWHTSITVSFVCNGAGSRIVGGCPAAVVLAHSGADLTVTRTIHTVAGDTATVTLRGIKLDTTTPRVRIVGVRNHALYHGNRPPASCEASDPVAGIRSCKLVAAMKRSSTIETITYIATAVSWAGVRRHATETVYSRL